MIANNNNQATGSGVATIAADAIASKSSAASAAASASSTATVGSPMVATAPPGSLVASIYQWLFDPDFKAGYQRQIDRVIAVLIVLSVFAVVLETIPEIHAPNAGWFHLFDLITVGLFTVEYVLRVLTAPMLPEFARSRSPRLRYVFSLYALIDLIAIAPFYLVLSRPLIWRPCECFG